MTNESPLPWDHLADCFERLRDAERACELAEDDIDRMLDAAELEVANTELARAQEGMRILGELLLRFALEEPGLPLQKRIAHVFGGLADAAWERATKAGKRANWAIAELDALKQRVRELENEIS